MNLEFDNTKCPLFAVSTGRDESGGHWMTPALDIPDGITLKCNRYHVNVTEESYWSDNKNKTVHWLRKDVWWEVSCHDEAGKGEDFY